MIEHHYCPRCRRYGVDKILAERQHYVYDSGEFKCPRCGYTGYSDDFDKEIKECVNTEEIVSDCSKCRKENVEQWLKCNRTWFDDNE